MKKSHVPPKNDVHTSEDILTKMIKKFPFTLNFFWVVYIGHYVYVILFLIIILNKYWYKYYCPVTV